MSEILEQMYRDVLLELMEVRSRLQFAEEKLQIQEAVNIGETRLQMENYNLRCQLEMAKDQLASQERAIQNLQGINNFFKEQNNLLVMELQAKCQEMLNFHHSFVDIPETNANGINTSILSNESVTTRQDEQPMTLAMKLKMCPNNQKNANEPVASKVGTAKTEASKTLKAKQTEERSLSLRLFIGHLHPSTVEATLEEYFKQFGQVVDVYFPRDGSGQHRGFAFVTFTKIFGKHPMEVPNHVIDGSSIYIDISSYGSGTGKPTRTLLVSGIIQNATNDALHKHFSKYGKVLEVVRSLERDKRFSRWAFVHFQDFESVDKALSVTHSIDGQCVDCRRAQNFNPENKRKDKNKTAVTVAAPTQPQSPTKASVNVTKLLIGNLKSTTTTETMKKHFTKFGTVLDAYIPTVYGTGGSKGFGYIVMPTADITFCHQKHIIDGVCAKISKEVVNDKSFKSSTLLVSAGPPIMKTISESDLKKFFSRFGKISSVRKFNDPVTKKPSHYAFVQYASTEPVDKALANLAYKINDKIVCITKSRHEPHK